MRVFYIIGLVLALALLGAAAYGSTVVNLSITIDENGHGLLNGNALDYHVDSVTHALYYNVDLPVNVGWDAGDVVMYDNAQDYGLDHPSDIVRFSWDMQNNIGQIWFYSDGGDTDLADQAWTTSYDQRARLIEQGTEGNNWVDYAPLSAGNPGWVSRDWQNDIDYMVSYHIISDVPEPSSLLALLCGFGGVGGLLWKRIR